MATMIRRLLATLLVSVAIVWCPGSAQACSCAGSGTPCDAAWRADALFVGHVVSMSSTAERRVELAVIEPFRGLQLSQVTVVTGYGGADCGYPFEIGQSYLVYAHRTPDGQLTTSICSPRARQSSCEAWCSFDNTASGAAFENARELMFMDPEGNHFAIFKQDGAAK
jgi:hypothetical protein